MAFPSDTITAWLNGQSDGVYNTAMNGGNIVATTTLESGSGNDYTLSIYSRRNYGGSVAGIVTTVSDTSYLESLSLSYTSSASQSGNIYLVYQEDGVWTMISSTFEQDVTTTLSVDLSETTLTSSTVYVVVAVTGTAEYREGTISLTATAAASSVPEPATASLSLLGLGALLLRRRRA